MISGSWPVHQALLFTKFPLFEKGTNAHWVEQGINIHTSLIKEVLRKLA